MSDPEAIPVGVVGCGRMGRLHARVYAQMPGVRLAGVYDADRNAAEAAAREYGAGAAYDSVEALAAHVRAATVAVPTTHHVAVAERLIDAGVACLVEKPLAETSALARRIADLGRAKGVPVVVGHIERFNPAVRALRDLSISPQFIEVTRVSPMTFRSVDVGVVLDLMIHDIDIVLRLANAPVERVDAVGVSVMTPDVEDICNARVTFANGCVANLTASRLAFKTLRSLRVFAPDAYVSIDYQKRQGVFIRRGQNVEAMRDLVRRARAGELTDPGSIDYAGLVDVRQLAIDDVEPLRAELDSFVATVRDGRPPEVPAEDGVAAVELAERIVAAMPKRAV